MKVEMKTYAYMIPIDDGAAPNPYGGVCTLAICKPNIRKIAQEGDWLVGFTRNETQTKKTPLCMVYAMRVTQVMSMEAYDRYTQAFLSIKVPDIKSNQIEKQMGDSVYDFSGESVTLRDGVHSRCTKEMDLEGKNVLLSEHFYYVGEEAKNYPFGLNQELDYHKDYIVLTKEEETHFFDWLKQKPLNCNEVNAKPHRIGIVPSSTSTIEKSCCIRKKCERLFWKK